MQRPGLHRQPGAALLQRQVGVLRCGGSTAHSPPGAPRPTPLALLVALMDCLATITSVRGLVLALQAIRTNHKLPCAVTFDPSIGLTLRFLDGGQAMQSGISLSATLFSHFQAPTPAATFFVPLSVLLDSIATVASSMPQELHLQYPGPERSLLITGTEDASTLTSICSYAKVATLAHQDMSGADDMWDPQDACSQVILPGLLLREAIEDLEWTGGEVEVVMRRSPARLSLQSIKQQSLEITFPAQALDGFSCHEDEVRASYKHKHLKAAFTNIAQKEPWSAKVCISSRGVLKVTHMLIMAGQSMPPMEAQPLLGTFTSQGNPRSQACVVQFIILPHDEAAEEATFAAMQDDE